MDLQNLWSKAQGLARGRKGQVGKGLDKVEQVVSEKTAGKYDSQVSSARQKIEETLTGESESPATQDTEATSESPPGTDPTQQHGSSAASDTSGKSSGDHPSQS